MFRYYVIFREGIDEIDLWKMLHFSQKVLIQQKALLQMTQARQFHLRSLAQ